MLRLSSATEVGALSGALSDVLATPLADPMTPEWVAVPTVGMRRWLALELARSLGASRPDAGDGVAANIRFTFPGELRRAVLEAGRAGDGADPWDVEGLVWAVLEVLRSRRSDERLGPLNLLPSGATWFGRARRLADLLDRYAVRRPELVLSWSSGRDVDGAGRPLLAHDRWQPHLWRAVRACVGVPSPPERLPELLDRLRAGELEVDLPSRLTIFGIATLPGGAQFVDLVEAVAVGRELHLMVLDPSPVMSARVRASTPGGARTPVVVRADDDSASQALHPLLRTWGRPYRECTVLLASAEHRGILAPRAVDSGRTRAAGSASLLSRVQDDLRSDRAPAADFDLGPDDRSIQVHSCHGDVRQVEVLRDAILHLLADDPTLREEDIAVLCPAIDRFAPLVAAGFGTSAEVPTDQTSEGPPRLLYRITDRSLRDSYPMLAALESLVSLVSGRCTGSAMLDFVSLPAVRERFGLDEEALRTIAQWVVGTNVRWGLDGPHRARWGLPPELDANSWRAAIDRVVMGVAVSDDDIALAPGQIAPLGVEGAEIAVAGRLADVLQHVAALTADMEKPRTAAKWCDVLSDAIDQFFGVGAAQQWQLDQVHRIVAEVGQAAVVRGEPAVAELSLADLRRLLADRLVGLPRRPDFFRGGVTVSSLTPLRSLPFRVICLLGLDDAALSAGVRPVDGDDLAARFPLVGDHDARSEIRQALLEAVLTAGDHLVVTRSGHDIRTNSEVPSATALAELRDTILGTLSPATAPAYRGQIETVHPRQPFDERCFRPDALHRPGPWSFDAGSLAGACARRERAGPERRLPDWAPLAAQSDAGVVTLAELHRFLRHPVKAFMTQRLGLHLADESRDYPDDLMTALGGLERWSVADRLLRSRFEGHTSAEWRRHERALGTLPPGGLGDDSLDEIEATVDGLLAVATHLGVDPTRNERVRIDVRLDGGTRIVGTVVVRRAEPGPGPALVTYSRASPRQHVQAWLDLVVLVACDPATDWRSVLVRRANSLDVPDALELVGRGETSDERRGRALAALEVATDCRLRGMREPLPLFAGVSAKLYQGSARPDDWQSFGGSGDGQDEVNRMVFGDLDFRELCSIAARADDPAGSSPGRAERFAEYLWGAIDASAEVAR